MTATAVPTAIVGSDRRDTAGEPGRSIAWWGMVTLIMTESTIFAGLLAAYFFLRGSSATWPLAGIAPPELPKAAVFSVVLWASSGPVWLAERAMRRGAVRAVRTHLAAAFVMGSAFLVNTVIDFRALTFGWRDNAYGSIFYAIVGLHTIHLLIGLVMNLVVHAKLATGRLSSHRHETLTVVGLYWHFVDVVWVAVFGALFVGAHVR